MQSLYVAPKFCFFCGGSKLSTEYGIAAGPLGVYTFCDSCEQLIGYAPDFDKLDPEDVASVSETNKRLQTYLANSLTSWRRREEIIGLRALLSLVAEMPVLDEAGVAKVRALIGKVQQTWNRKGDCI